MKAGAKAGEVGQVAAQRAAAREKGKRLRRSHRMLVNVPQRLRPTLQRKYLI